jgi:adenosine deaminase
MLPAPPVLLPKVELHVHLDCSLSYAVVAQLAPEVTEAQYRAEFIALAKCTNLADFLTRAPRGVALMQTAAALALVVDDPFDQLVHDGVIYAEVRFAPLLHTTRVLTPEAFVKAVADATEAAVRRTGVEARLILCTLRHFTEAQSLATARLVGTFRHARVAALDLAADEAGASLDAHVAAYAYAREHGLARTAHAGEARGAESVWETLRRLTPSRIGHGVRSVEDPTLVAHLIAAGVHLEVCPTSNVQTDVVPTLAEHPVDRLYRAGVPLGINTDARTITDVTLSDEYARLATTF